MNNPCFNEGICLELPNNAFECNCTNYFTGQLCEIPLILSSTAPTTLTSPSARVSNSRIHLPGIKSVNPWKECAVAKCPSDFNNGICETACNNPSCLYDGLDCASKLVCPYAHVCSLVYGDGACNIECDSADCAWDGGDCRLAFTYAYLGQVSLYLADGLDTIMPSLANITLQLSLLLDSKINVIAVRSVPATLLSRRGASANDTRAPSSSLGADSLIIFQPAPFCDTLCFE